MSIYTMSLDEAQAAKAETETQLLTHMLTCPTCAAHLRAVMQDTGPWYLTPVLNCRKGYPLAKARIDLVKHLDWLNRGGRR
ncbi:MAG TPA: hypothetical protein VH393_10855 [Ktedonobacterales bacterium]|jgi:hypothetical protein